MNLPRVILIAGGCFSPPTPMHFRMFEIARDYFEMQGTHEVIGGIVTPTHDAYGKKGLIRAEHRCAMVKLVLRNSDWIRLSDWECQQQGWTRTLGVLQHHQNCINNVINSPDDENENSLIPSWLPSHLRERRDKVQLKLLCGADLLQSFAVPDLWQDDDIIEIVGNHGLVVISRSDTNPEKFIFESDILTKYQRNIALVTNWVANDISSSLIRRLLSRGQSVKYLLDDLVLDYISCNGLFDYKSMNLDNRRPKVFCCGDNQNIVTKLTFSRSNPGQAVQVISTEMDNKADRRGYNRDERKAKKMKLNGVEIV